MEIISYLAPYHETESGVEKKIQSQIKALENNNCIVYRCVDNVSIFQNIVVKKDIQFLLKSYQNISELLHSENIVYCRGIQDYLVMFFLLLKKRKCKLAFEIQTIEKQEFLSTKSCIGRVHAILDSIFGGHIKSHSDGIVSVTNEVMEYNRVITKNRCKYLILGNGIDVDNIPMRNLSSNDCMTQINVLCVAQVAKWHGVDRFIRGLHEYESTSDKRNIVLHIVGDGPELPYLKELTSELNLQDNVIFHGFKSGKELDEMFEMCHIALGSLGGFRINMHEMSSLKSGEYCARGMPFVIAAKAIDFPDDWPYILHVLETEESINMDDVIMFANRVMADTNHPQIMREYAEQNLDWSIKMKKLKEFLESL